MSIKSLITAAAILLAVTGTAAAQSSGGIAANTPWGSGAAGVGGPTIGGNFESNVEMGDSEINVGPDGTARNQVGSASGGTVGGNFESNVEMGDSEINVGPGGCADQQVGSMGPSVC